MKRSCKPLALHQSSIREFLSDINSLVRHHHQGTVKHVNKKDVNPNTKISYDRLIYLQSLKLESKIELAVCAINEWYEYWDGQVYVSFSGGKDSTVLLDLVRTEFPDVPAMFINTGIEYPESVEFVKTFDNVEIVHPSMKFRDVIERHGYPAISKEQAQYINECRNTNSEKLRNIRLNGKTKKGSGKIFEKWKYMLDAPFEISAKCCDIMRKNPAKKYEKVSMCKPFIGKMAIESNKRKQDYTKTGCNAFTSKRPTSNPLGIWTDEDIWNYIKIRGIRYNPVYDKGYDRTGCLFCLFGIDKEPQPNRLQRMKMNHPKYYELCMERLGFRQVVEFMGIPHS